MKNKLLLVICFCGYWALSAQSPCSSPQSQIDLWGNNISARILNGGNLFTDLQHGKFIPNPSGTGNDPSTIFTAGLWIGGFDPAGNLRLDATTYQPGFWAGPLNENGETTAFDCTNWDRHFLIKGDRIKTFLDGLSFYSVHVVQAETDYPDIMGWPGRGNPYFFAITGFELPATAQALAPFKDMNGDGLYNPLQGDYPAVVLKDIPPFVPAVTVWSVFNDQGGGAGVGVPTMHMEIQQTAWAFNCQIEPVLNNTIFTSHKLIYRGADTMDSTFVGMWTDFDLGCYEDDYIGCKPELNTYFVYNQDAVDGQPGSSCSGGVSTFGDHPPVQSATFLNKPLDIFIWFAGAGTGSPQAGMIDPATPHEYYNYMAGHWRDNTPLTYGGSGYSPGSGTPVDHAFSDDPSDPNGWSMCTANLPLSDRRVLGTYKLGAMVPGRVDELNMAWTVHENPSLPCGLGNTDADISTLHTLYDQHFAGVCSPITKAPEAQPDSMDLFPNPATEQCTLRYGKLPVQEIRIHAADGRWIRTISKLPAEQVHFETAEWPAGVYMLEIMTGEGRYVRELSVVK